MLLTCGERVNSPELSSPTQIPVLLTVVKGSGHLLFQKESATNAGMWGSSLLVGCLMSKQHASVSQGRICSDKLTCCHTEIETADKAFYLTQSQHTDTGPTSPSADPIMPGAWQGSHWSANFCFGVT